MIVDSVHGSTVYLKNCGYGVVTNNSLNVYLDDVPLKFIMTPQKIGKGEVGTITIDTSSLTGIISGDHDLKISNPNLQIAQRVAAEVINGMAVIPDSTILALDFDEGSGTIAYDKSGLGNNGNLINNPNWVGGIFNNALNFIEGGSGGTASSCGTQTCVNTTSSNPFPTLTQITISAWVKQQPYSRCELVVVRKNSGTYSSFRFGVGGTCAQGVCDSSNPNPIIFQIWCAPDHAQHNYWSNKNVSLDTWHHIMANYNGTYINFYLDGEDVGASGSQLPFDEGMSGGSNSNYIIGASDGGCQGDFNGIIDSIRIYNKSFTPENIKSVKLYMK
jgi:hypothetical protein